MAVATEVAVLLQPVAVEDVISVGGAVFIRPDGCVVAITDFGFMRIFVGTREILFSVFVPGGVVVVIDVPLVVVVFAVVAVVDDDDDGTVDNADNGADTMGIIDEEATFVALQLLLLLTTVAVEMGTTVGASERADNNCAVGEGGFGVELLADGGSGEAGGDCLISMNG